MIFLSALNAGAAKRRVRTDDGQFRCVHITSIRVLIAVAQAAPKRAYGGKTASAIGPWD